MLINRFLHACLPTFFQRLIDLFHRYRTKNVKYWSASISTLFFLNYLKILGSHTSKFDSIRLKGQSARVSFRFSHHSVAFSNRPCVGSRTNKTLCLLRELFWSRPAFVQYRKRRAGCWLTRLPTSPPFPSSEQFRLT